MRPYFAIIKDAFREAFASKTLWILLILISLLLLVLFPITSKQELSTGLRPGDVKDAGRFVQRLVRNAKAKTNSPGKHIVSLLDEDVQATLKGDFNKKDKEEADEKKEAADKSDESDKKSDKKSDDKSDESDKKSDEKSDEAESEEKSGRGNVDPMMFSMELLRSINEALKLPEFYDEEAWDGRTIRNEAKDLVTNDPAGFSQNELEHRNRLLLQSAFPDLIKETNKRSYRLSYNMLFTEFDITGSFPMEKKKFQEYVQAVVLFVLLFAFGTLGILIAIMVTSPIIPQTFDPGSLNLLLSKPVSRSLVFISQYVGGLAFITILASYLFIGLWFVLGLGLEYWNFRLFWYIPTFVFIFAIYYAVSSVIGLWWRSTTLCIICTLVFGVSCYVVGVIKSGSETVINGEVKTKGVVSSPAGLMVQSPQGALQKWNMETRNWDRVMSAGGDDFFSKGPFYDAKHDRMIGQRLNVGGGPNPFIPDDKITFAGPEDNWGSHAGEPLPVGTLDIQPHPEYGFLVFSISGIHKFTGEMKVEPVEVTKEDITPENEKDNKGKKNSRRSRPRRNRGGFGSMFDMLSAKPKSDKFEVINDEEGFELLAPWSAAVNQETGDVVIYSGGLVTIFSESDGKFKMVTSKKLEGPKDQKVALSYAGDRLLVSRETEGFYLMDGQSLETIDNFKTNTSKINVRSISPTPNGDKFAVVLENNELWICNVADETFVQDSCGIRTDIASASFMDNDKIAIVDVWKKVFVVDINSRKQVESFREESSRFQWIYRYVILPIYTIFPKPGKLNNTVQYFVTGDDTREDYTVTFLKLVSMSQPMGNFGEMLESAFPRVNLEPWPPVWNGFFFICVVLGIGCIFIERQQY